LQLLVSVRSADEVGPALAGGADIIDAKEPDRGSLGAVAPEVLAEILARTPGHLPFSAALGDAVSAEQVKTLIDGLKLPPRAGPTYLKLGFAGMPSPDLVSAMLSTAVSRAGLRRSPPLVVAVAYADARRARSAPPELVSRLARDAGAAGVLIDTCVKDGVGLLEWLTPTELAVWVRQTREWRLLAGVAGALGPADLPSACLADPDVVGFRGAACDAGRSGRVVAERVMLLRDQLDHAVGVFRGRSV
jgi:(5-formylfuran-3-yl)methyl phosphate synthase